MSSYNTLDIYSFTNKTVVIPRRRVRGDVVIRFGDNTINVDTKLQEPLIIDTTDELTITQSYNEMVSDNSYRLRAKAKAPGFPETITEDVYNKLSPSVSAMYQRVINEEIVTVEIPVSMTRIPRQFLSEENSPMILRLSRTSWVKNSMMTETTSQRRSHDSSRKTISFMLSTGRSPRMTSGSLLGSLHTG